LELEGLVTKRRGIMDIELRATIATVKLGVKVIKGVVLRKCKMAFDREFDDEIAQALGGGARKALASLRTHEMEKVIMGIDRIDAKAKLVSGDDTIGISLVRGEKATCSAATDDDDDVPKIRLEFETAYDDAVWSFLGRNCGGYVHIEFKQKQLNLKGAA
jgi:hypothetical protein